MPQMIQNCRKTQQLSEFFEIMQSKYYNFCLFHSVQRNLVAQTGDPTGSGRGGESIFRKLYGDQAQYFEMELVPKIKHKKKGTVSMVNNGNDMHGSQFFITLEENLDYLDGTHTVFGEVAEGFDIVDKINEAYCDKDHRPFRDIRIYHTVIIYDPYDDPPHLDIPAMSPVPTKEQLESDRIGDTEELDDTKGMTEEEMRELMEQKEAKSNAQILEMVGDLPDVDVAPPENVLFVCKLNPVTTEEDLEIIFSRFGNIRSCEVIKDSKTKESLQYAFIEFEKPEECENAYFKMDNVLIDDRRIHVDFSQSVAKLKWKGKGKGVEMLPSKPDPPQPQYVLKNNSRKEEKKYELVLEDDDLDAELEAAQVKKDKKKKKKKKKKHKRKHKKQKKQDESDSDQSASSEKAWKKASKSKHEDKSSASVIHLEKRRKLSSASPEPIKGKSHASSEENSREISRSRSPISRSQNRANRSDRRSCSPDSKRRSPDLKRARDSDRVSKDRSREKDRKSSKSDVRHSKK
ncbi:peptidyl-prolyl cis-trans isomerase-like 4 [Octopus vulgaris]|uniref:Peptidyl-prolyl cis-trans isomerase n=2 Tax=Octopus vulgaris TaxID=6645 RepID=A0AA36ANU0_OCTVU|nr:peptidyl-prolyl cis-trans isomerase-like 4 [Octopus vulgaris]